MFGRGSYRDGGGRSVEGYSAVECALVHCLWRKSKNWQNINENHDGVITHLEPDILEVKSSGP